MYCLLSFILKIGIYILTTMTLFILLKMSYNILTNEQTNKQKTKRKP